MKKHTFVLLSFVPLCCAALLISCSNLLASTGSVNIALPGTGNERSASNGIDCLSSDASYYEVSLSAQSGGDVRTAQGNPGEQISFDSLEPGLYTVTGKAFNSNKVCIAAGTAQASVEAGKSADLSLALYLNTTSSITALTIKSYPTKTTYTVGETFSLDGLEFEIAFSNGYSMTLSKDNLSLSLSDATGAAVTDGQTKITTADTEITIAVNFGDKNFTSNIPLTITGMTLTSISAKMVDGSYAVLGHEPEQSCFVVTEIYSEASSGTTSNTTSCYTIAASSTDKLGTVPVTITSTKNPSLSATVSTFTYKYETPSTPTVSISSTASTIPTIIGTATLSATASAGESYSLYENGTKTDTTVADTLSYQWYSVASDKTISALDGGTESTYVADLLSADTTYECIVTATGNADYCASLSTETATATTTVSVTPWTLTLKDSTASTTTTLSSGGTVALTASDIYTMSFANTSASPIEAGIANNTSYVSWALGTTGFATIDTSSGWTFTAPTATNSEQSSTFTATYGNYTLGSFTATVAASTSTTGTTITTYAALETAVKAVTSTSTTTTFILDATTMEATSNIAVTGKVQIIAVSSGCTITRSSSFTDSALFTVVTGGTLILGDSGGSLIIDGGYTSSNTSSTNALISATSSYVTIGTKCTLQNNYNSSTSTKGGGVYCSGTTELTVNGTIKGCYSASNGGGIYAEGTSTSEYVTVAIIDGTITGNSTPVNGGGLYLSKVSATLKGATISNNKATTTTASGKGFGGGIFYSTSSTTLSLTITKDDSGTASSITGNTGGTYGGGVYINYGICNLVNGSISSNITGSSTAATSDCGSNVYCTAYGTYQINGAAKTSGTATAFDDTQTTSN